MRAADAQKFRKEVLKFCKKSIRKYLRRYQLQESGTKPGAAPAQRDWRTCKVCVVSLSQCSLLPVHADGSSYRGRTVGGAAPCPQRSPTLQRTCLGAPELQTLPQGLLAECAPCLPVHLRFNQSTAGRCFRCCSKGGPCWAAAQSPIHPTWPIGARC